MRALICPISTQRTDEHTARLTALLMALMVASAALTGSSLVMAAVAADFVVRAFTGWRHSPASWLAARILRRLGVAERPIDRAPKIFAARVGLSFALASAGLWIIAPLAGLIAALVLLGFAVLEAVLNICAGCYVYTYLVAPRFLRAPRAPEEHP